MSVSKEDVESRIISEFRDQIVRFMEELTPTSPQEQQRIVCGPSKLPMGDVRFFIACGNPSGEIGWIVQDLDDAEETAKMILKTIKLIRKDISWKL